MSIAYTNCDGIAYDFTTATGFDIRGRVDNILPQGSAEVRGIFALVDFLLGKDIDPVAVLECLVVGQVVVHLHEDDIQGGEGGRQAEDVED